MSRLRIGNYHYLIIAVILCWTCANVNLDRSWNNVLEYDIAGYYAYLPAVFIHHDLSFGFYDEMTALYSADLFRGDYRQLLADGTTTNKYFAGTAVLQLPFFLMAHLLTLLSGGPADGYSYLYVLGVALSSIFYVLLGLWWLSRILQHYEVEGGMAWALVYAMVFSTNIFVYAAIDPGMSHAYSFAAVNGLVWFFLMFKATGRAGYFLLLMLLLGLIVLIRPVNVLAVLGLGCFVGPATEWQQLWQKIRALGGLLFVGLLLAVLIGATQLLIYWLQTGNWVVYSYADERFDFTNPQLVNFLFSYRKGYFLYTPLALIATLCLPLVYRFNARLALSLGAFGLLLVYVFSSWWSWWYGGSFSSRVMLEYSVFVFLPLGLVLKKAGRPLRNVLLSLMVACVLLAQFQIYQFRHGRLHYSDTTKEIYWSSFGRQQ